MNGGRERRARRNADTEPLPRTTMRKKYTMSEALEKHVPARVLSCKNPPDWRGNGAAGFFDVRYLDPSGLGAMMTGPGVVPPCKRAKPTIPRRANAEQSWSSLNATLQPPISLTLLLPASPPPPLLLHCCISHAPHQLLPPLRPHAPPLSSQLPGPSPAPPSIDAIVFTASPTLPRPLNGARCGTSTLPPGLGNIPPLPLVCRL